MEILLEGRLTVKN